MNSGSLDRQITIQSKVAATDSGGGYTETWSDVLVVWADRADQGSREFRAAGSVHAETTTLWKMRYRDGITAENRIKHGSQIFDIISVSEIGRKAGLQVQAKLIK